MNRNLNSGIGFLGFLKVSEQKLTFHLWFGAYCVRRGSSIVPQPSLPSTLCQLAHPDVRCVRSENNISISLIDNKDKNNYKKIFFLYKKHDLNPLKDVQIIS